MIGIIGALKEETNLLIERMENKQTTAISGILYVSGKLMGKDVVVATCGIGKVFASLCAEAMILRFAPDALINAGVAGTLSSGIGIGDVAVASAFVQHDMDTSPIGDPVGLVSGINVVYFKADIAMQNALCRAAKESGVKSLVGTIASGDQFIADAKKKRWIVNTFSAVACDMEGGAIAQVAFVNKVPFAALRSISDSADGNAVMDYPSFVKAAAAKQSEIICRYLSL